ncbi:hypothetical protein [Formosa sp. S-31]
MKTLIKHLRHSQNYSESVELNFLKRSIQNFNSTKEALWYGSKRYAH